MASFASPSRAYVSNKHHRNGIVQETAIHDQPIKSWCRCAHAFLHLIQLLHLS